MNIDENVQKIIKLLIKKWKLLFIFAILGAVCAFIYTANFTTPTYTSSVEFLASAEDPTYDMDETTGSSDYIRTSETSKMNYAMKMISTYIEIFQTNEFCSDVADQINKKYGTHLSPADIKSSIKIDTVEDTAMFKMAVTTNNLELSYSIAHQLEESVPEQMKKTNKGLVQASVEDKAIKPVSAEGLQYPKKCLIGMLIGIVLAAIYVILRDVLDVRVKGSEDLKIRYDIPVLGSVPDFGNAKRTSNANKNKKGAK